ncbi:hypothetical protein WN943_023556 [Citrus x changshan-huyou]
MNLGTIVYEPPRNGPTLWRIEVPHRLASEFFVLDPYAKFKNPLFTGSSDKYRQDGLWERYADFYSNDDLKYTIGVQLNPQRKRRPLFSTGTIGRDNAIARHGFMGCTDFTASICQAICFTEEKNNICLSQSRSNGPFQGVMYDYIRFEAPPG